MSTQPITLPQILEKLSQHHHEMAKLFVQFQGVLLLPESAAASKLVKPDQTPSLGEHLAAAGVAVPGETAASEPAPLPAAAAAKKAPGKAVAAATAPAAASAPTGEVLIAKDPAPAVAKVIVAMQAHAARFKAAGGAVATLKKVKAVGGWTSASSVPEEKRAELIAALDADSPAAGA